MESTTQQDVAAEVRAQIARHRRSGRSIALQLGWQQKYLSRRLTGVVPFDVNDLAAIAAVLDVPVAVFFAGPTVRELPARLPYTGDQLRKQLVALFDLRKLAVAA